MRQREHHVAKALYWNVLGARQEWRVGGTARMEGAGMEAANRRKGNGG